MTGLGLYEYTQRKFGSRIRGLNFASSIPLNNLLSPQHSALVTRAPAPEVLATRLLQAYESRSIRHPIDRLLREDFHKPERLTTSEGRVSIVASRTESGHADHFWSLALALHAAHAGPGSRLSFTALPRVPAPSAAPCACLDQTGEESGSKMPSHLRDLFFDNLPQRRVI